MRIIKGNVFTIFVTVILKVSGFWRDNATADAVLDTNLLTRYKIAFIVNYLVIKIATIGSFNGFYHNSLKIKGLE